MRKFWAILSFFFLFNCAHSQIIVINTGTKDNIYSINKLGNNILVASTNTFLSKCYGDCDHLIPLTVPSFPDPSYLAFFERPDTSVMYLTASSFSNLRLTLWKSTDGGYNWIKKFDTTSTDMYDGITRFFDKQNGITFCSNQKNIVTNDGFSSYHFDAGSGSYVSRGTVFGDSTIIISSCGGGGGCAWGLSFDRGTSWPIANMYGSGIYVPMDLEFLNKDTIFVVTSVQQQSAFFFSTFNRGLNWNYTQFTGGNFPPQEFFFNVCAKNKNEIYMTGRNGLQGGNYTGNGIILKSTDLGKTWSTFATPFKANLYDMKFLNDSIALVCGDNGLLFKWNSRQSIFTGISENKRDEIDLIAFPNPVTDKLTIKTTNAALKISKITISNALGQIVFVLETPKLDQGIDISFLPGGIYYLNILSVSGQRVMKIVKE